MQLLVHPYLKGNYFSCAWSVPPSRSYLCELRDGLALLTWGNLESNPVAIFIYFAWISWVGLGVVEIPHDTTPMIYKFVNNCHIIWWDFRSAREDKNYPEGEKNAAKSSPYVSRDGRSSHLGCIWHFFRTKFRIVRDPIRKNAMTDWCLAFDIELLRLNSIRSVFIQFFKLFYDFRVPVSHVFPGFEADHNSWRSEFALKWLLWMK